MIVLHYAPAGAFLRWMAAHPGYVICSTLTARRTFPGCWTVLMEKTEP